MSSRLFPWFFVVGFLLLFVAFSFFSVNETEFAIRTRFGEIIDTRYTPGLHLKWPWDKVAKFDRRTKRRQAALTAFCFLLAYALEPTKRSAESMGTPSGR